MPPDNAIFTAKFSANLGPKIAGAVLPLGLPLSSLPALIGDLASNNQTALPSVPGITPQIIGAGVGGLFEAYSIGFRYVWICAGCLTVIGAVCKFSDSQNRSRNAVKPHKSLFVHESPRLTYRAAGSVFLVDPVKEFNSHIDAPAEKEEELFK